MATFKNPHPIRTVLASLCGILALGLILCSIVVVWLNRTFTDTKTYTATVAPLINNTDIQHFVATQASDILLQNAPPEELAGLLVPAANASGKSPDELKAESAKVLNGYITNILDSQQFQDTWRTTNANAHQQLVNQLRGDSDKLSIDLSPMVRDVVAQVKESQLAPLATQIQIPAEAGVINLQGGGIDKAHQYYKLFQAATVILVAVTVLAVAGCVLLSVQHWRTVRRILVGTGLLSIVLAVLLQAPRLVKPDGVDAITGNAALALFGGLTHNLQVFLLVFGAGCIAAAVASKLYTQARRRTSTTIKP